MVTVEPADDSALGGEETTGSHQGSLSAAENETVRLTLRGTSIIDWPRFQFRTAGEVERFLRLNEYDLSSEPDVERLWHLTHRAVDYLERTFGYVVRPEVLHPERFVDIFLMASDAGIPREVRESACVLIKLIHIINHIDARELGFLCSISDRELFRLMEEKTMLAVTRLKNRGLPIVEATGSRKLKDSLITKLLSKRETLAAQIFDKLRFRVVVKDRDSLLPLLIGLTEELLPFNYVVPTQSRNSLVDLDALASDAEADGARGAEPVDPSNVDGSADGTGRHNEFSGTGYRDLNFVVDVPLRLPDDRLPRQAMTELGRITFVLVEFQLLDLQTARDNELGENAHTRYKTRQLGEVEKRLFGRSSRLCRS